MVVTGWFVLLVAVGVVPIVATSNPLVLAGWLLLCLLLLVTDALLAASPRAVRLSRELPAAIRLGESAEARLTLANTGRRRMHGVARDAWQPSAGASPRRFRVSVAPGRQSVTSTTLTPFRRGERTASAVTVRAYGPLRLGGRQATHPLPGAVRVLPRFSSRKHLPSRLARLRELDGRTSVMIRGQGTEFDSLREYVRGDDVRSIDWRATARRQDLVVRTWRPERDRRVVVVIDSGRTSAARIGDEPRLDTAFESALLLGALASRAGDRVDLAIVDRRVRGRVQGASGAALLSSMVTTMAPIDPDLVETDWTAVPALVRAITTQRSLIVLATTLDAPGAARNLLAAVPQLTARHLVVVASVVDPALSEAAHERSSREQVYRAASAERALLDIARVSAALRQLGADVVTGSPPTCRPPWPTTTSPSRPRAACSRPSRPRLPRGRGSGVPAAVARARRRRRGQPATSCRDPASNSSRSPVCPARNARPPITHW
ncbi:lipoprotein [Frondihabitans sucicola]|uniref:Lipoprotein n=1 Tax=Frondihabitans sucicola TaxID=1268041 RepID=A0ABN6Y2P3_9MICO|nr:lipoprotein [Frondihabitans sucicola]